jgi:hypothetical protein
MISARSGSQRSHTSSSVNFATGSRNSLISQSCGSRRSLPRLSARRWRAQTQNTLLRTASTRPREGLRLAQLVNIDLNSDAVLVRREVADVQLAKETLQNLINEGAPNPLRRCDGRAHGHCLVPTSYLPFRASPWCRPRTVSGHVTLITQRDAPPAGPCGRRRSPHPPRVAWVGRAHLSGRR